MSQQTLPLKNITHLIPQKTPFVMVDTLIDFSSKDLVSKFTILESNIFVRNKMFLETGLIENMAQSVALHTGYDFFLKGQEAPTGYIGSIKSIVINKLPQLNDVITTKVAILQEFMGITMVNVNVFNSRSEVLATGEMKTVIAN